MKLLGKTVLRLTAVMLGLIDVHRFRIATCAVWTRNH